MRATLKKLKARFDNEMENPSWILISSGIVIASTWTAILAYRVMAHGYNGMDDIDAFLGERYPDVRTEVIEMLIEKNYFD